MAKPKVHDDGTTVTIWLDKDMIRRLDVIAAKVGISRSRLVSNLLGCGLDDAESFAALGILDLAVMMRDFKDRMSKVILSEAKTAESIKPLLA